MISNVCLTGRLGGKINAKFRQVEIDRTPIHSDQEVVDLIPISYWNTHHNSRLSRLDDGVLVMIKGRLERDPEIGIYIQCEHLEYISKLDETKEIKVI